MESIEEQLHDLTAISDASDLDARCMKYASVRQAFRARILGAAGFGAAEVALGLSMLINGRNMNQAEIWACLIGHLVAVMGVSRCVRGAIDASAKSNDVLSKISDYRLEHPNFETDSVLRQHSIPLQDS